MSGHIYLSGYMSGHVFLARFPEQIRLIRNSLDEAFSDRPSHLTKMGSRVGVSTALPIKDDPPNLDDPYFPGNNMMHV
jgi:hypothetical protein